MDEIKVLEAMIMKAYSPLCSGTVSGRSILSVDDEPPPRLPLPIVQSVVIPTLQKLASDCRNLSSARTTTEPNLELMANGLVSKLEAIHGTSFTNNSNHVGNHHRLSISGIANTATASTTNSTSNMPSSTSMDDMKQKVGKLFQKTTGGQPFWKK